MHVGLFSMQRPADPGSCIAQRRMRGYSLIEFMIAITVSLVILAALSAMFVASMRTRDEVERANQQIENGRYATQLMTDDVQLAGYLAEFDIWLAALPTPAALPDVCTTAVADLTANLPLHVQGQDDVASGAEPSCISDLRVGTDIVVIRRVSSCILGAAGCDTLTGAPYFQASLCSSGTELLSLTSTDWFRLSTDLTQLNRTRRDCSTAADRHRFLTHIYFVANNDQPGDGIPTLKRAELGAGVISTVPLVNGIDDLQIEYGIDSAGADGIPDSYTADPSTFNACVGAACVENWRNVVSIKLNVLARSTTPTPGYSDTKTYVLGLAAGGAAKTVGPFSDTYKRHAFQTVVQMFNPAGRRH